VQILLSETSASSPLAQAVQSEFEATPCESISRKMFSENKGLAFLKAYGTQLETISIDNTKYLCLACVSALGTWIENTQNVTFAQKSIPVQFKSLDGHMLLDYNTVRNLEIVYSLNSEVTSTGAGGGSIKKKKQVCMCACVCVCVCVCVCEESISITFHFLSDAT
jgi:DNA mismatch repair ATPase MutS